MRGHGAAGDVGKWPLTGLNGPTRSVSGLRWEEGRRPRRRPRPWHAAHATGQSVSSSSTAGRIFTGFDVVRNLTVAVGGRRCAAFLVVLRLHLVRGLLFVAVVVVRVRVRFGRSVQHGANDRSIDLLEHLNRPDDVSALVHPGGHHEQDGIGVGRQDGSISHRQNRRAVHDDDVCVGAEALEHLPGLGARQELRGVRRNWSSRKHLEARLIGDPKERVFQLGLSQQDRGEPDVVRQPEELVNSRSTQVTADQHDPLARLGHDPGEIGRRGGLAVARRRAGDLEDLGGILQRHELDGGSESSVGLSWRRFRVRLGNEIWPLAIAPIVDHGNQAEHGDSGHELLELILASDPVVQVVTEEGEPDAHQQSSHDGDADIAGDLW